MKSYLPLFLLLTLLVVSAFSQEFSPQFEGFFFRAGGVFPESGYNPNLALSGGISIAFVPSGVATISLIYWGTKKDYYGWKDQSEDDIKYAYMGINLTGLYKTKINENFFARPYVGIGLALNKYSTNYPEGWPDVDKSKTSPEPHIDAGFEFPHIHQKIKPCIHLKYTLSDVGSFLVMVGINVNISK